uniref:Uncharacterized protein n=1 Tax=Panagrolaimus sp. ES5 TaxID=591445 RepID=A0AC34F5H9_9BILA
MSLGSNIVANRNRSASLGRSLQQLPYQANPLESFSEQYSQLSQIRPDADFGDGAIVCDADLRRPRLEHSAMRRLAHAALVSSYLAEEIEAENAERLRQRRDTE